MSNIIDELIVENIIDWTMADALGSQFIAFSNVFVYGFAELDRYRESNERLYPALTLRNRIFRVPDEYTSILTSMHEDSYDE